MRICEIYRSRQGEGFLTGTESWFIRTSGCNLRCWFCDTPFTSWNPEGESKTIQQILDDLDFEEAQHIVLTGGEPMLSKNVGKLSEELKQLGFHITIETAGTIDQPVKCDLMSISPKLSNSTPSASRAGEWSHRHERRRHQPAVVRQLIKRYEYQVKFVVDSISDCGEIEDYLQQLPDISHDRVMLMPQGTSLDELVEREKWLKPYCESNGFNFCPRKHIEWYGNKRGT